MQQDKFKQVSYGNDQYIIRMMPPSQAIKILARLTKITGGSIGSLAGSKKKEENGDVIAKAFASMADRLDEDLVLKTVHDLMSCVDKEGQVVNFDKDFVGKVGTALSLCKDVLEVNFSDFLDEISQAFRRALAGLKG